MNGEFTEFTADEAEAILKIKELLKAHFADEKSFKWNDMKHEIFHGYCEDCGTRYLPCYCRRDD